MTPEKLKDLTNAMKKGVKSSMTPFQYRWWLVKFEVDGLLILIFEPVVGWIERLLSGGDTDA